MIKKLIAAIELDMRQHSSRWQWLFVAFIMVYFGEVVLAKVSGVLTSPERQFLLFWLVISLTNLIPFTFSVVAAMTGIFGLMLTTWLLPNSGLVNDLAAWTLFFMVTAVSVVLTKQKNNG